MKQTILALLMCSALAGATGLVALAGDPCVQPHWEIGDYAFIVDPNFLTGHPVAPIVCVAGETKVVTRLACDLEGDVLGPIEVLYPPTGVQVAITDAVSYAVRIEAPVVGVSYITLRGWDAPDPNIAEPNYTVVTIPVQTVYRKNHGPILY